MQNTYWEKDQTNEFIRVLRPILVLLICAVHLPYIAGYTNEALPLETPQMLLSVYIKDVLARSGVPLLSIISGYLAFYSYKKHGYKIFLHKKVKSLLIPFIIVNIVTLIFLQIAQHFTNSPIHAIKSVDDLSSVVQAILGINRLPVNGPLYFLRDLFLICCGITLIDLAARSRLAVSAIIAYILYLNFQHPGLIVRFGDTPVGILYRLDMVLFFLLGYCLSLRGIKPVRVESYTAFTAILLYGSLMLLVAIAISAIKPASINYLESRWAIGLLAFFFIPAFMELSYRARKTRTYKILLRLSPYSFMMFLTHFIFATAFMKIKAYLGFSMTLTSPIHLQLIYFSIYLLGCTLFSIAIRKTLMAARSKLLH